MSEHRFDERDLERNEDPEKVAGAVSGATGAGVGGGIGLAALGPLGAVIGALAGAAGGWWAGKEMQQAITETDRAENRFRDAHAHEGPARPYEEVRHGYRLGHLAGGNPHYADRSFLDVEEELRAAWVKAHLEDRDPVSWDEVRSHAQTGYEIRRGDDPSTRR